MYTLFDGIGHEALKPLTYTRPVADLRIGILTIKEKWEKHLGDPCRVRTKDYLRSKFDGFEAGGTLGIAATALPTAALVKAIKKLEDKQLLMKDGAVVAINELPESIADLDEYLADFEMIEFEEEISFLINPSDIFRLNGQEIEADFQLIKDSITPQDIHPSNQFIGEQILIEEGAKVQFSMLNASDGPIFIEAGAEIMEGTLIRGPFVALEGSVCKMGAKIYGPTTLGPYVKVGGEINNCVFQGYSNKGHDGFLGNSVVGEWCNIGADTNSSNLKNNYGNIKVWSYVEEDEVDSGLQFHGLIMGDHSKCGINTMFNTGTIIGVNANVFGGGFPAKFIPSFVWGGADGFQTYDLKKAIEVGKIVMERRSVELNADDEAILTQVFEDSKRHRESLA
ncbi:MAG: UDP-N-acetylglucosamine diphosphorylase/glucosamine-1-phosphate N-acetyltransferase [Parvicellaceae bacterium]|jgi:UDP-N-acetylglucosamine diphosphorylase/glucosamine-1-phosphate N-acetyltransferase